MFGAVIENMASGPACGPGRAVRSSSNVVGRDDAVSPPDGRPYPSLRGRSDFQRVFRTGVRRHSGGVTVVTAPGNHGMVRVGIVAGRRVGGAVSRNRAKRRLREAVARVRLQDGVDHVVIASQEVNQVTFQRLVDWIAEAMSEE